MPLQPQQSGLSAGTGSGDNRSRPSTSDTSAETKPRPESRKSFLSTIFPRRPKPDANSEIFPGRLSSPFESDNAAADIEKLRKYTRKIKGTSNIDTAYEEYEKIRDDSRKICKNLLNLSLQRRESSLVSPTTSAASAGLEARPESSLDVLSLPDTTRSSTSIGSLADALHPSTTQDDQSVLAVRDWERCLETLADTLKKSLWGLYEGFEDNATPEGFEEICTNKAARIIAIRNMREANVVRLVSRDLNFFPRYDIRFRNYDQLKKDLDQIHAQLHAEELEISPERQVITRTISAGGDVIVQFVNTTCLPNCPIYRFRVSSSMLADKSPFFRRIFRPDPKDAPEVQPLYRVSLSPTSSHGSGVKLYSIFETEFNREQSLEILLKATHGISEKLDLDVGFEKFVAIAEVCLRYQYTAPLEFAARSSWLPKWAHKVTDDMSDGLLLISYAFGLPADFTCMSWYAILNIVDEDDLKKKHWPQNIKDRIGAVRRAKTDQIYDCCKSFLLEYMSLSSDSREEPDQAHDSKLMPGSLPRCQKGDPKCAASNVGWMMMVFRDLGILHYIIPSTIFDRRPAPPNMSLAQLVGSLRLMTSHPDCHSSIACDFALPFRREIDDIYASISGLTLFDVSGKREWALSKGEPGLPRFFSECPSRKRQVIGPGFNRLGVTSLPLLREATRLELLGAVDNHRDRLALAMVDKSFYSTYRRNRAMLAGEDGGEGGAGGEADTGGSDAAVVASASLITAKHEHGDSAPGQDEEMAMPDPTKTAPMIGREKYLADEFDPFTGSHTCNCGGEGSRRKLVL